MKVGDIYINRYASKDNPSRVFIITAINAKYVYGKYASNGELRVCRHYKSMKSDTEHYEKLGHFDFNKVIVNKLIETKERARDEH